MAVAFFENTTFFTKIPLQGESKYNEDSFWSTPPIPPTAPSTLPTDIINSSIPNTTELPNKLPIEPSPIDSSPIKSLSPQSLSSPPSSQPLPSIPITSIQSVQDRDREPIVYSIRNKTQPLQPHQSTEPSAKI